MAKGPKRAARAEKSRATKPLRLVRPYPQLPLEKALQVASAIKETNGGNPLEPKLVAEFCDVSPKSNEFVYLLSASSRFGLTEGTIRSQVVKLTEFGRSLAYSSSPSEELLLKKQAINSVEIFRKVFEHYRGVQLPEMKYLGNTLQKEFGLNPELHDEFSKLFRENAKYLDGPSPVDSSPAGQTRVDGGHSVTLGEPTNERKGVCFVIMPFSEKTNRFPKGFFSEVLNSLIIPAATEAGFEVRTADRQGTEIIHSTIVNEVLDADIAICDLTEHNPNVLFELGMRLAHEKPVALIHAEGTDRVFDVDNILRVRSYSGNLWRTTLEKDIPELKGHLLATWDGARTAETYIRALRKHKAGSRS